jgi:hypothetical protein
MKKITLFLLLLTASFGYAQEVLENFEGTAPSTDLFDGFTSATVTANPTNAAEKSLELITSASGQSWQGAKLVIENNTIDMTTADKTMTVDIYSTTPRDFLFKLVDGDIGGSDNNQESKTAGVHGGSGWETITLDFNVGADTGQPGYNPPNDKFGSIVFFPLYKAPNDGWEAASETTTFIDNVTAIAGGVAETCSDGIQNQDETGIDCGGTCNACPSPPTTAAPTPPARNTGDVVSIYSGAYDDLPSNFDAGWCGTNSVTEVTIGDNATIQYNGNDCQGIVLTDGVDITSYTNMHVDVYIEAGVDLTSKVFNLKFVQQPGGAALEVNFNAASSPALVAGSWLSIDVPVDLSTFTGFKEFGITAGNLKNQVWYDNLYIYKSATLSVSDNELLNVSMYPNPTASKLNISAASTIKNASIFNVIGKKVMSLNINKNSESIDVSSLASGIYFLKYNVNDKVGTAKFIKQ